MRRCNDVYEIVTVYYPTGCVNTTRTTTSTSTTLPPTTTTTSSTSSTTTTTTTSLPNVPCYVSYSSGGSGVTEYSIPLDPLGGVILFQFSARNVPDKMEIIHNNVKKSTSGMLADGNSGPFDAYGQPSTNLPTVAQTYDINQFIGRTSFSTIPPTYYKNIQPIPARKTELLAATGFDLTLTGSYDQFVWWTYTPSDYIIKSNVIIRITGPSGGSTGWDLQRLCPSNTTTTSTSTSTTSTSTTAIPTTTTTTTVRMVWTYTFRYITCDTCADIGGGGFGNSQELIVGNYYITPTLPSYKILIVGFVSLNPGTPSENILTYSGATTCEGISCPTTTTTSTSSTSTTTTTAIPITTTTTSSSTSTSTTTSTTTLPLDCTFTATATAT